MEGVVALLDGPGDRQVRTLCAELAEALHLRPEHLPPFPHFSYQIAPTYQRAAVLAALAQAAAAQLPLAVTTAGVALFTGPMPVLSLPIVRTAPLSAWHAQLWDSLAPLADAPHPYYHPDQWVPHITLILGGLDVAKAAEAVGLLAGRALEWTIAIDNVCFVAPAGGVEAVQARFALGG